MRSVGTYNTTPATELMNKIGKANYSFSQLMGEYLDNSIDERIDNEKLTIQVTIENQEIIIQDNAKGMNEKELADAMTIALSKKQGKLGIHGIGMKAASRALGDRFEIITKKENEPIFSTTWDKYEWREKGKWETEIFKRDVSDFPQLKEHGTVVRISRLQIKVGDKIARLRGDVGLAYASYIDNDEVEVIVNGKKCKALHPSIIEKQKETFDEIKGKVHIFGWVSLLKNAAVRGMYGFNTFRNKRLITCYDKIGFTPHPALTRIIGEIYIEGVPVNINKTDWIRESKEFKIVEELMTDVLYLGIKELKKQNKKKYNLSKKEKNKIEIYKEGLIDALQSKELSPYTLPERKKAIQHEKKKNRKKHKRAENPTKEKKNNDVQKNPRVKKNQILIGGKQYEYKYKWYGGGNNGPQYDRNFSMGKKGLEIWINRDFPILGSIEDKAYYVFEQIAAAIAETIVEINNIDVEKRYEIQEFFLRNVGNYMKKKTGK